MYYLQDYPDPDDGKTGQRQHAFVLLQAFFTNMMFLVVIRFKEKIPIM